MRELDDDDDEERLSHLLVLVRRCLPIARDDCNRSTVFLVYPSDAALVLLLSLGELCYPQKNERYAQQLSQENRDRHRQTDIQ